MLWLWFDDWNECPKNFQNLQVLSSKIEWHLQLMHRSNEVTNLQLFRNRSRDHMLYRTMQHYLMRTRSTQHQNRILFGQFRVYLDLPAPNCRRIALGCHLSIAVILKLIDLKNHKQDSSFACIIPPSIFACSFKLLRDVNPRRLHKIYGRL